MKLEPLLELLESAGLGVRGKDLFINTMPASINGVMLRDAFSGSMIDHELPGYRKTTFQVIVRDTNYAAGQTLIEQVVQALTMVDTDLVGMSVKYLRPRHDPLTFAQTIGNKTEWLVNMETAFVAT